MTTSDTISLHLAKKLAEHGYNKYADFQYVQVKNSEGYKLTNYDIEKCAMAELALGTKFLYAPTLDEAYNWILKQQPEWNVAVLWDNKLKGFHFMVQNIKTGYEYSQPTAPGEMNVFRMYEWGMEHVLNRFDQKDKE